MVVDIDFFDTLGTETRDLQELPDRGREDFGSNPKLWSRLIPSRLTLNIDVQ